MIYRGEKAKELCLEILHSLDKQGRYPLHEGDCGYYKNANGMWTAWDNLTGDCWVEDFKTEKECIDWINQV